MWHDWLCVLLLQSENCEKHKNPWKTPEVSCATVRCCMHLSIYVFFFVRYVITGQKIFFMLSFWSKCSTLVPPWPFIRHFPSHYAQVYIFIFNIFILLSIFYYYTNFCLKYFFIYIDILIADKVVKTEMKNNTEQRLKLG